MRSFLISLSILAMSSAGAAAETWIAVCNDGQRIGHDLFDVRVVRHVVWSKQLQWQTAFPGGLVDGAADGLVPGVKQSLDLFISAIDCSGGSRLIEAFSTEYQGSFYEVRLRRFPHVDSVGGGFRD